MKKTNIVLLSLILSVPAMDVLASDLRQCLSPQAQYEQKAAIEVKIIDTNPGTAESDELHKNYIELVNNYKDCHSASFENVSKKLNEALSKAADKTLLTMSEEIEESKDPVLNKRLQSIRKDLEKKFDAAFEAAAASLTDQPVVQDQQIFLKDKEIFGDNFEDNTFALTFDDGPSFSGPTSKIIQTLQESGVPGNFFMLGSQINKVPENEWDRFTQMLGLGFTINNHSWDHADFQKISNESERDQITKTQDVIEKVTGQHSSGLFRFPYGSRTKSKKDTLTDLGYVSVYWNIDTRDWAMKGKYEELYKNTIKAIEAEKKGIIIFHDIHEQTSVVLPRVIKYLADRKAVFLRLVRGD